jgi:hypothetical protein
VVVLKYLLHLKLYIQYPIDFKLFKWENLLVLDLEADPDLNFEINSTWIPKTVKRLKITGFRINWIEGHKEFNLDKLVLVDIPFSHMKTAIDTLIQTKEIVLNFDWSDPLCRESCLDSFFEYLLSRINNSNDQRIFFGPCFWKSSSDVTSYADKLARYYLFENQRGKALDIKDSEFTLFEKIVDT